MAVDAGWCVRCVLLLGISTCRSASLPGLARGGSASGGPTTTIALYGELYDVADILSWHPGGAAILKQVHGMQLPDSTPLFESQHAFRDPVEMRHKLKRYRLNSTDVPQLYTFHEDGFYRTVRARVTKFLGSQGLLEGEGGVPGAPKGGLWMVGKSTVSLIIVLWLLIKGTRAAPLHVSSAGLYIFAAGAVFTGATLFQIMHDLSHHSAFHRNHALTHKLERVVHSLIFWDQSIWQGHHVLSHHPFTGNDLYDSDGRNGEAIFCKLEAENPCSYAPPSLQLLSAISNLYTGQAIIYAHVRWGKPMSDRALRLDPHGSSSLQMLSGMTIQPSMHVCMYVCNAHRGRTYQCS